MKILYILVRTDMDSLFGCPGKGIAQGAHAAQLFARSMENSGDMEAAKNGGMPQGEAADYLEWCDQADGFGTVLTLGCTEAEMREVIKYAEQFDMHCGLVTDPTYPLRDGDTTHFFPVDTCAWVFGDKEELRDALGWLELHP